MKILGPVPLIDFFEKFKSSKSHNKITTLLYKTTYKKTTRNTTLHSQISGFRNPKGLACWSSQVLGSAPFLRSQVRKLSVAINFFGANPYGALFGFNWAPQETSRIGPKISKSGQSYPKYLNHQQQKKIKYWI